MYYTLLKTEDAAHSWVNLQKANLLWFIYILYVLCETLSGAQLSPGEWRMIQGGTGINGSIICGGNNLSLATFLWFINYCESQGLVILCSLNLIAIKSWHQILHLVY